MALTVTKKASGVEPPMLAWQAGISATAKAPLKMQIGRISFDSSYPTGGETLDLSDEFPNEVLFCAVPSAAGYTFEYVHDTGDAPATGKVKAYVGAGTEVPDTTNLSSVTNVEFIAFGW